MELFTIKGTKKTPEVTLNPNGDIRLSGRSIPEDASKFFEDVINWVIEYCKSPRETTTVNIELEYFNSGSAKYVMQMLRELSEVMSENKKLIVNWHYEEGDDDILERGEYYSTILNIDINFIETE